MLIVNILNIFTQARSGVSRGAGRSAGFRPVDLRFRFTAEAFQRIRLAAEILPLLAGWTNGVRRRDLLPFPAAEGGAEQAGPHDDAPTIGRRVAHGDIDATDAHRLFANLEDDFAVRRLFTIGYHAPRRRTSATLSR